MGERRQGRQLPRNDFLWDEAFLTPERSAGCQLADCERHSAHDNLCIPSPDGLDIDHGDNRSLIAVSARSSPSKTDQDPA